MKRLFLLGLLVSGQLFAVENFKCTNDSRPDQSYRLVEMKSGNYQLTVKKVVADPVSCRSRWGCDSLETVVYEDRLRATDYQGVMYFESKKTTVNMEYMDEVEYTYTTMANGRFVTRRETLKCEIE